MSTELHASSASCHESSSQVSPPLPSQPPAHTSIDCWQNSFNSNRQQHNRRKTPRHPAAMLVSLTVGKVDAGVTVLLTPDKRLIEFPSILLPPNISSGSIVDINVSQNATKESAEEAKFRTLQERIHACFGAASPLTPVLRCRNATQTSVVLEWDPIALATADLVSLTLYRNGQKAGTIPRPRQMHSTKISGLAVDTEYTFHLVLRTSAGTRSSDKVAVRTHKMTDLSGITITAGFLPAAHREALARAVERIGAKMADGVRIDTTHFVTTEGRGTAWEKAVETNIPVVRPEWVDACEKNGRILGVTKFYLDAMRPGPPSEATPTSTPPPQPTTQKNLPQPPPPPESKEEEAGEESVVEGQEDAPTREERKSAVARGKEGEVEPKARRPSHDEEQKMRLEDKDGQKFALRPEGSRASVTVEEEDTEEAQDDKEEAEAKEAKKPASTADGDSFQEVQL
ncbi:chitin biosynthesis protein (Chs5), putative [Cordyceps militaris CM01]|uniref:Chitin biosynthesis protein (Chs5), putative n=1 Tax=Cordyceps militaris (strain CM01) TaxID=983644 RepID=G3JBN4_CORMM|nr:chitin biosynthesis protein (Chs5), putative [Cordyceps militaris CM01]EGX95339.1 chitin biosynthesis protein (Chs5), putative [Cordyceps militaris CM01]